MFDEFQRLQEQEGLRRLLAHYAEADVAARETWQDRLMELEGVDAPGMVRLHGELLAHAWIEQNTGAVKPLPTGRVPGCYRITPAGQRALRVAQADQEADGNGESAAA